MALVNLKSTLLSNRDAVPKVVTDAFLSGGILSEVQGSVKTGASDNAGSQYRLISVPSNARVSSLIWQADSMSSSGPLDLAVWYPTTVPQGGANFLPYACGAAIISSSIFAANLAINGAAVALTEITNQSGNYLIPLQETPLWNVLGFTADPEITFDMGFTARAASGAAGYVSLKCRYQF